MDMLKEVKEYRRRNVLPVSILGPDEAEEMADRIRGHLLTWTVAREAGSHSRAALALGDLVFLCLSIAVREGAPWHTVWGSTLGILQGTETLAQAVSMVSEDWDRYAAAPEPMTGIPREVWVLCGSSRFKEEHLSAMAALTLDGHIVIPMGVYGHADGVTLTETQKAALDDLHLRKIDMAVGIYVVDVDGYVGDSTRGEILYAEAQGKRVRYWSKEMV